MQSEDCINLIKDFLIRDILITASLSLSKKK